MDKPDATHAPAPDIRAFRERHGLSQQGFADAYGFAAGRQYVSKLELGKVRPTLRLLRWMASRDAALRPPEAAPTPPPRARARKDAGARRHATEA